MSKKQMLMPPLVLTIICLLVAAALVATYQFTKPYIDAAKAAAADAARREVFPGEISFAKYGGEEVAETAGEQLGVDGVTEVYEAYNGQDLAGYVLTTTAQGFGGPLVVMTGFDTEGNITGTKLVENSETPGLGTKVGEEKYTSQYVDKNTQTYTEVDAISGATISSVAYRQALANAAAAFEILTGGAQ